MKLDRGNGGPSPPHEVLRAILHGVAAGACEVAARETGAARWSRTAEDQREKARALLHQTASARMTACATANTSKVMPKPFSLE